MNLNNLFINAFRGATKPITLNFSPDKKITLIYAENGNGKSTIADAFVCLCTDEMGSLGDKSNKDYSFLKSLGSNNAECKIQLTTDENTFTATLAQGSTKLIKVPSIGLPKLRSLRRAQITSFIEDTPSDRYKVMATFIDVANIQKSESELKKLITAVEREYGQNVKSFSDAMSNLNQIWEREGKPLNILEDWIRVEIAKDNTASIKELSENNSILQKWESLQTLVLNIQSEKVKFINASNNFELAEKLLKEYKIQNPNSESDLLALLNEAKAYLDTIQAIDKCPVCEKGNERQILLDGVNLRIGKMQDLNKLSRQVEITKNQRNVLYSRLRGQIDPFNSNLIKFKDEASSLSKFKFKDILNPFESLEDIKETYKLFSEVKDNLLSEIQNLKIHTETVNKSVVLHNSIKTNHENINKLKLKCLQLEKLMNQAKATLKIIEEQRKIFIDNELNSISGEVELMYQRIHPNEGLGNIKLFLNHNFQSSLNLTANFLTEIDITPQSLYSESHLDTLGICIFIALAKKESNRDVILILDDVVMSVDEKHLDRIIDLIHDEAKNFAHVFISTHYRPWRERYRNNRAPNSNIQFIELRKWSLERGITQAKPQLIIEELRYYLAEPENFHRENVASLAGRFLEAILDFLTLNYQSRIKRKPVNDYTLSELLDSFSKDLLTLMKVEKMEKLSESRFSETEVAETFELKPIIDELKALKAVRNQVGAHYTFDGALFGDSDIEDFAKSTLTFTELLVCPLNGNLPDRNKGSYWETKSGSIRLYPLVDPK